MMHAENRGGTSLVHLKLAGSAAMAPGDAAGLRADARGTLKFDTDGRCFS
jgi:hypothetical protein